jgi:glycosyltransferase involved in cell wall biosynthesis
VLRILFVHNGLTPFVQLDLAELRGLYHVTECHLRSPWFLPITIWNQVKAHDVVFGWFASWHTWLPMEFAKLLGKPSVLVVGGYDLANMPEIGYGHQRGGLRQLISRRTMRAATQLITNSNYSREEAVSNAEIPKERLRAIYHGVPDECGSFVPGLREPMVLTVGNIDRPNLQRKGHASFVRTAALMPDLNFVLVGAWKDDAIDQLRSIATANVSFTGRVTHEQLQNYYRRASVYVQPSLHEGFGLSVAEAMLAGCVPVVTRAGALPEVVGQCGEYVDSTEPQEIADAIETALAYSGAAKAASRQRILDEFPMERRGRAFGQILTDLTAHESR